MRIALINENSQKKKNDLIFKILTKVANKYGHTVFNYGAKERENINIDYVGAGILTSILLTTHAVDFVITGCASGQGVMIVANSMPNVTCGYITDPVDVQLFAKINAGNAISIPFGKYFGIGSEMLLENIFTTLFTTKFGAGYPLERAETQNTQRQQQAEIKRIATLNLLPILEEMDKDMLYNLIHNDYFQEHFFLHSEEVMVNNYLKDIIDTWEEPY